MRTAIALLLVATLAVSDEFEVVPLRVIEAATAQGALVDRGASDGLAVGDRVLLHPREGATLEGEVTEVKGRSALVRLLDAAARPEAGTRGEALLPKARFAKEAPPEDGESDGQKWKNGDEGFTPDMALLAQVKPVRPEDRPRHLFGRAYVIGALSESSSSDVGNSFLRVGSDITVENPIGRGGRLRVQSEIDAYTAYDEDETVRLLVPRFSYAWGGTRFRATRWEVGRFLQDGVPEFGVLDGAEYGARRENGHRYGASIGFQPEPDEDFSTLRDFQIAGYYEYVSGPREELTLTGALQKSWHNANSDRDLVFGKARYLPGNGWDLLGTLWIDLYTSSDVAKTASVEVTQALFSAARHDANGNGFVATFRHQAFPDIDREGEFIAPTPTELADGSMQRLSLDAWRWINRRLEARGLFSGWLDEEGSGGSAELGIFLHDFGGEGTRVGVTGFVARAEFENATGGRVTFAANRGIASFDALYEISLHHQRSFLDDLDDLVQHRFRAGVSLPLQGRWDLSAYGEGLIWDDEFTWTFGFTVQKRF